MNNKYSLRIHSRSSYQHLGLQVPPAAVLSPRATLLLLCVTLADQQCSAKSTAALLAITLQLVRVPLPLPLRCSVVESKRRLKLNKSGSFLTSVALTQAARQIGKGLGYNYIAMLRYYWPIPSSGSLASVGTQLITLM